MQFIGNGAGEGTCMVHNSTYDLNDDILPVGATSFSRLVETALASDRFRSIADRATQEFGAVAVSIPLAVPEAF